MTTLITDDACEDTRVLCTVPAGADPEAVLSEAQRMAEKWNAAVKQWEEWVHARREELGCNYTKADALEPEHRRVPTAFRSMAGLFQAKSTQEDVPVPGAKERNDAKRKATKERVTAGDKVFAAESKKRISDMAFEHPWMAALNTGVNGAYPMSLSLPLRLAVVPEFLEYPQER